MPLEVARKDNPYIEAFENGFNDIQRLESFSYDRW